MDNYEKAWRVNVIPFQLNNRATVATKFTSPSRGLEGKRLLFMVCDSRGRIVLCNGAYKWDGGDPSGVTLSIRLIWFFYGGQFILAIQLINPNFRVLLPHRRSTTFSSETSPLFLVEACRVWQLVPSYSVLMNATEGSTTTPFHSRIRPSDWGHVAYSSKRRGR